MAASATRDNALPITWSSSSLSASVKRSTDVRVRTRSTSSLENMGASGPGTSTPSDRQMPTTASTDEPAWAATSRAVSFSASVKIRSAPRPTRPDRASASVICSGVAPNERRNSTSSGVLSQEGSGGVRGSVSTGQAWHPGALLCAGGRVILGGRKREPMKLKLDLHDIYNRGTDIDQALRDVIEEAVRKKATLVEIIPGKGSGQLKKRVLRFLDTKEMKALYHRVEKDSNNFGRIFVHFRWK